MVAGIQQGLQLLFCKLTEIQMIYRRGESGQLFGGPLVSGKTINFFVRTHFNTSIPPDYTTGRETPTRRFT